MGLSIDWQPLPAGTEGPDRLEAATWSEVRIIVDGSHGRSVLTRSFDPQARTLYESVADSVLPLAEWLVKHWFALVEVPTSPPREPDLRRQWDRAHALRRVGSGAYLPDLRIWRVSSTSMRLQWRPDDGSDPYAPVQFIGSGEATLPRRDVVRTLGDFIDGVIRRATAFEPAHARLVELVQSWEARRGASGAARAERLAAGLGLIWSDLEPTRHDSLRQLAASDDYPFALGLAEGMDARVLSTLAADATRARDCCSRAPALSADLRDLRRALQAESDPIGAPWEVGWRRAAQARARTTVDAFITRIATEPAHDLRLSAQRSAVGWLPDKVPVRWASPGSGPHARFAALRDLYPVLFVSNDARPGLVSLDREERGGPASEARAFATELIAPVEQVRALFDRYRDEPDPAERIARELQAPYPCVYNQLNNHEVA